MIHIIDNKPRLTIKLLFIVSDIFKVIFSCSFKGEMLIAVLIERLINKQFFANFKIKS